MLDDLDEAGVSAAMEELVLEWKRSGSTLGMRDATCVAIRAYLAAASRTPAVAVTAWQPIATAPMRDGTEIDLWLVRPDGSGWREPKCHSNPRGEWLSDRGCWVTGRHFTDEEGDRCFDPGDTSPQSVRATHWQPPPAPPERTP